MTDMQLRLAVGAGPLCDGCELREPCGAAELDEACQTRWGDPARGGVNALHPLNPATWEHIMEVGGVGFEDVVARAQVSIALPAFAPHIRPLRALRGQLVEELYLVGLEAVRKRGLSRASWVRTMIGLHPDQGLGLILFGKDDVLERLWPRRFTLAAEVARAGYDFCVPPSYSNYPARPRTEFLFNAKRSLFIFQLLQLHGVPTIPRVAWLIDHDARRFAAWIHANPVIECVALDLSGSSRPGWERELRLLSLFDRLTDCRLSYLIHGPSTAPRCFALYELLGGERVHITNARAVTRPPDPGMTFADRLAREAAVIHAARRGIELVAMLPAA